MANRYDEIMEDFRWYPLPQHLNMTEEYLSDLERAISVKLPQDYREFLQKYGVVAANLVIAYPDILNKSAPVGGSVEVFFGKSQTPIYDLISKLQGMNEQIPREYLPIASCPGGMICLGVDGPNRGKVYWWDQEEEHEEREQNLLMIAHSFDSFMKSLFHFDFSTLG